MTNNKTKIIVTLGPATCTEQDLRKIKDKGVAFVRANMSHSSLADLKRFIDLSKQAAIPFIIDTEGSQVRTGDLDQDVICFEENDEIRLCSEQIVGNRKKLCLRPGSVIAQLEEGDLIHIDFDTLILRVTDTSAISEGYVTTKAITGGFIGKNKAVVIDPVLDKSFDLPALSEKDLLSIQLGLEEQIGHIAVSFVRSAASIKEVREKTQGKMRIISKVECIDALMNLDEIIRETDFVLIDRGDLSKEIPIEKIPFTQKIIIDKANREDTGVFVATNLLETMVEKRKPTRAEVHDVMTTILDGAMGLALAAETAIGKYPMECINTLNKLIRHTESTIDGRPPGRSENGLIRTLAKSGYLLDGDVSSHLSPPHGGKLVNRVVFNQNDLCLDFPRRIELDLNKQMEVEQIAIGAYSPLEGFMGEADFHAVLDEMRLNSGVVWPIPITLDVSREIADKLSPGERVGLTNERGETIAILHLEEKYTFDKEETARKLYGTSDDKHPGVRMILRMNPILLGGKIDLLKRRDSDTKAYELTPKQLRRLFDERGWSRVLGFHTRNVIHKGHEYIQLRAMEQENCDGLLVHPVVGKKKEGDFHPQFIIKSYERMAEQFYPKNRVVFATFATYSRYAGPREALFTALCRKNYGCSHFIVGRDHTGVGNYYPPDASQKIFDQFPDLGIKAVRFGEVFYCAESSEYLHRDCDDPHQEATDKSTTISGSQAREMFQLGKMPPQWFMRPEISEILINAVKNGEEVFVDSKSVLTTS